MEKALSRKGFAAGREASGVEIWHRCLAQIVRVGGWRPVERDRAAKTRLLG
jgi:hypothetical protein